MARARKSSSRKGKKAKVKAVRSKKPGRKGFEEIWLSVGRRLVKEIRAERNWDQKTFLANVNNNPEFSVKVLESAKSHFPAAVVPVFVPETRNSLAPTREEKGSSSLNIGTTQYWGTSEPEVCDSEACDSDSDSSSLIP